MYANLNYILLGFFKSRNLELMLKTQSNKIEISRISWQLPHSSLIGIPQIQIGIPQKMSVYQETLFRKKKPFYLGLLRKIDLLVNYGTNI